MNVRNTTCDEVLYNSTFIYLTIIFIEINFNWRNMRAYITIFDCNNQYLPTHGFNWVKLDTICSHFWSSFVLKQEEEVSLNICLEICKNTACQYQL